MSTLSKQQIIDDSIKYLKEHDSGFFITLNTLKNDPIKLNNDLLKLTTWLNDYCYGNRFRRGEKRLKIVAGTEYGKQNNGLHTHIVITFDNDMQRRHKEINMFIRKKWYKLINAKGSCFGTLADIQVMDDLEDSVNYSLKDADKYVNSDSKVLFL